MMRIGGIVGPFGGPLGIPAGMVEPARYDIPEDRIRELAIERAAGRVRDIVEVIRRAVPDAKVELCGSLAAVAVSELEQAMAQVRFEHLVPAGIGPHPHPFARVVMGEQPVAYAETPVVSEPHRFDPSPVPSPDGDPRPRCTSCAQHEDALIHHPDLIPPT